MAAVPGLPSMTAASSAHSGPIYGTASTGNLVLERGAGVSGTTAGGSWPGWVKGLILLGIGAGLGYLVFRKKGH